MEKAAEAARGAAKIGTTSRGIGPAYEDKMSRSGLRVCDLMEPARFREKLKRVVLEKDAMCRAAFGAPLEVEGLAEKYLEYAERLRPLVVDASALVNRVLDEGRSVLFEGAQGTMLDIDYGTYPFVTSSNATAGGACTGLGVAPTRISGVAGVTKAYTTHVAPGPFPRKCPIWRRAKCATAGKSMAPSPGAPAAAGGSICPSCATP